MNLTVEIGNTALKAAWTAGDATLGKSFRYQGERVIDFIISLTEKDRPDIMAVASVYDISQNDEKLLAKHCCHLILLDPHHHLEVSGLPTWLGSDRTASITAARYLFKGKACTIVDLGNTLTIDFIDDCGNYDGGFISPGCRTRLRALNRYSKSLPLIEMPEIVNASADSLERSIGYGVVSGIKFEIQGHIDSRPDNIVLFTGGDAIYFVNKIKNSIFVICNLVLMGLALISDEYVRQNIQ